MSKEEKIIRDLKKRNDSLLHQYDMARIREIHYENKSTRLQQRIDKAIKYIERHTIEWVDKKFEVHNVMVKVDEYFNPQALVEILKGGDE